MVTTHPSSFFWVLLRNEGHQAHKAVGRDSQLRLQRTCDASSSSAVWTGGGESARSTAKAGAPCRRRWVGNVSPTRPGMQGSWHPLSLLTWLLISWGHAGPASGRQGRRRLFQPGLAGTWESGLAAGTGEESCSRAWSWCWAPVNHDSSRQGRTTKAAGNWVSSRCRVHWLSCTISADDVDATC